MLFHTHLAFAFLIGLIAIPYINTANPIIFMAILLFAGILPDIDHAGSKIGRWFKPIGWIFEHRGFFHSALGTIALTIAVYLITKNITYATAFILGYTSHLLADAITDSGIMFLHPFSKRRFAGFFRTGSFFEHIFLFVVLAGSIFHLVILH